MTAVLSLLGPIPYIYAQSNPGDILVIDRDAFVGPDPGATQRKGVLFRVNPASGLRTLFSDFGDPAQGPLGVDPQSVALEAAGTILVADIGPGEGVLFRVNPASGLRTLLSDFGNDSQGPGSRPIGVAVEAAGTILVVGDPGRSPTLVRVNPATGLRTLLSNFLNPSQGPLGLRPTGIAVEAAGTILVVDDGAGTRINNTLGGALFRIAPETGLRTLLSDFGDGSQGPLVESPLGVAVEDSGTILVVNVGFNIAPRGTLLRVNPGTGLRTLLSDFSNPSQGPLGLNPWTVAVEASGAILVIDTGVGVSDSNGQRRGGIFRVDPVTGIRTFISDFGNACQGPLGRVPYGMAVVPSPSALDVESGPGSSACNPVVPCVLANDTLFFGAGECDICPPGTGCWYDPPFVEGFTYTLEGGATFTEVAPPPASFGFGPVQVVVDGAVLETLNPGEPFFFPPGVSTFALQGIAPLVDAADPLAFPTFLDYTGTATGLTMAAMVPAMNPVAQAGADQTVNEGTTVTLDGSGSSDPQGRPLSYSWTQVSGLPVILHLSDPVHPTFAAPAVPIAGATLSFQLTVSNGQSTSTPAMVNITVKHVNHAPVALVGPDQSVAEASLVTLDGSASFDPDAEPLTYRWQQVGEPTVTLSDPQAAQPTFLAPLVGPTGATLRFQLTVSDGLDQATATTNVNVTNINHPPVANAGPDQTRQGGSLIHLDGTASTDPDSDPLTFTWSALGGPPVTLSDVHSATPSFLGPQVTSPTTFTFQLLIDDGLGGTARAEVHITILPVDAPPLCTQAVARPARLWPPNHKLVDVKIVGVTDPNHQQITLTVTHVTQDEPVGCVAPRGSRNDDEDDDESRGCRHTTPDAVIHPDGHVSLRAERRAHGNGRVYHLGFHAEDEQGGQCTGHVTVCVPHDRHDRGCGDDGPLYDATQR